MKSPAFQFYAADYLASQRVQLLTVEQEGIYIRLLASCWLHGSIPADAEQAARLVGKGALTTLVSTVLTMFQPHPSKAGELVHDRLEREREKQSVWRQKSSEGGKKSANLRWGDKNVRVVKRPLKGCLQNAYKGGVTLLSSSSSSIPLVNGRLHKPTLDEVQRFGQTLTPPLPIVECDTAFDRWESNGWKVGSNPMKNWQATLRNWHRNWQSGKYSNQRGGKPDTRGLATNANETKDGF